MLYHTAPFRRSLAASLSLIAIASAAPALAQDEEARADAPREAPAKCIAPQTVVPPFNNTPEAMEQSRVAATIVAGDSVCKGSALMPELSEIQHGPEEPVVPEEGVEEPAEPA